MTPLVRSVVWALAAGLAVAGLLVLLLAASMFATGPGQVESGLGGSGADRSTVDAGTTLLRRDAVVLACVSAVLLVGGSAAAWRLRPTGEPGGRWIALAAAVTVLGWLAVPRACLAVARVLFGTGDSAV